MRVLSKNELGQLAGGNINEPEHKGDLFMVGAILGVLISDLVFEADLLGMTIGAVVGGVLFTGLHDDKKPKSY